MTHGLARGSPGAAPGRALSRRPGGVAASPVPGAPRLPPGRSGAFAALPPRAPRAASAQAALPGGRSGSRFSGPGPRFPGPGKAAGIEQPALLPRGPIRAEKIELFKRVTWGETCGAMRCLFFPCNHRKR